MWKEMETGASGGYTTVTPTQRLYVNESSTESSGYTPDKDVMAIFIYSGYNSTCMIKEDGTTVFSGSPVVATDAHKQLWTSYQLLAGKTYTIKSLGNAGRMQLITLDLS